MNIRSSMAFLFVALLIVIPALVSAQSHFRLRPPLWVDNDDRPIPRPQSRDVSDIYGVIYNTWLRHLSIETAAAKRQPALNINAWDETPNSTWFTNRIGRNAMSFEEIVSGIEGRSPQPPPWRIISLNASGDSPKIDIEDASGNRYVLKFDPQGASERNSGAERVATLIAHAAGYNVPHNTIAYFRHGDLQLDQDSYYVQAKGNRHPLTPAFLDGVLQKLDPSPDGRYRVIASLYLPEPLGPFMFTGRRHDDPNDMIPHELRREIRGLRVLASWINLVDVKDSQALDSYYTLPDGRKFVKHYLLDFSAALGAFESPGAPYRAGHEYLFDGAAIGRSFISLGLWKRPWEVRGAVRYPEIGYFMAQLFEPAKWKPSFPNLAFEQMDDSDAYWGAKIVTAFSDELINRLAQAGEYSRPAVTGYLEDVLRQRRDAIGNYWLNRVSPLEEIALLNSESGSRLLFRDLAIERGYADRGSRTYRYWVEDLKGRRLTEKQTSKGPELEVGDLTRLAGQNSGEPVDRYGRIPSLRIFIQSNQNGGKWALPTEIVIGPTRENGNLQLLGWTHAPKQH